MDKYFKIYDYVYLDPKINCIPYLRINIHIDEGREFLNILYSGGEN